MTYQSDLKWLANRRSFPREQQKILLALSNDKYKWRTMDRLRAVTDLERDTFDTALAQLMKEKLVIPTFSPEIKLVFGLRERVDSK